MLKPVKRKLIFKNSLSDMVLRGQSVRMDIIGELSTKLEDGVQFSQKALQTDPGFLMLPSPPPTECGLLGVG